MTRDPGVGDVEALARVRVLGRSYPLGHEAACAVLASDWLAADRARVRAETLAEVERMHAVVRFEDFDIERLRGMAEAGVGFVADSDSSLRVALSQAEERLAQVERERDMYLADSKRAVTALNQILDEDSHAEAALADLRSRIEAVEDEWSTLGGTNPIVTQTYRLAAEELRALLDTEADQ